ncbi:MAG: GntR family transcriptional regulator [Mycobacteriales bacterium]
MLPATSDAFSPVSRTPLSLLVSRQLRDAIVSGELSVGTLLPSEKELADRFGVSRSTIREALRILQALGLLTGGDTVSTARPRVSATQTVAAVSDVLESAVRLSQIPLGDLVELRLVLEGAALESPVTVPARLEEARAALEVMQRPGVDVVTFHDADVRFHTSLAGAGGNSAFTLVMGVLREAIGGHLVEALSALPKPVPTLRRLCSEHAAILQAVEDGDGPLAARLVREHIWSFYSRDQ